MVVHGEFYVYHHLTDQIFIKAQRIRGLQAK